MIIDILGSQYTVKKIKSRRKVDPEDGNENDGCTNRRDKWINLYSGLRNTEYSKTLFREIGHGVCTEYNVNSIDEHEDKYTLFMDGLFDAIKRNKLKEIFK